MRLGKESSMRGWHLLPITLLVFVVIALPVAAITDTGIEREVRNGLGLASIECEPMVNADSPWVEGPALPFDLDEPRAVALGGNIYLLGGITGLEQLADGSLLLEPSDALLRFDPETGAYTELAPLPQPLNHIAVVAYRGDIYVVGGYGETLDRDTRKRFYRYDVSANRWSRLADMPAPRAAAAAGVIGGKLIIAGGALDNEPRPETFAYDFASTRWSQLAPLPSGREHSGAAVLGQSLYVLGGRTKQATAVRTAAAFDAGANSWRQLPPMPVASGGLAVVAHDGDVIAVAGGDDAGGTVTGAIQEFDPRGDRWALRPALRTPRHGHGAAIGDGRIWVFGGSPCAYFNATDDVESLPVSRP